MAKISVIVPIYNTESFLVRCLNSLQRQTEKDIEFILINDASTDKSLEIMELFCNHDPRFKMHTLSKNEGVSIARNKGIDMATGTYIGFIDSDDYIDSNYFETLKKALEESNMKIAMSTSILLDYKPKDIIDFRKPNVPLMEGGASSCMRLFERELIGDDRFIEHCRFEDSAFTFLMHMKSNQMIVSEYSKYYYCSDNIASFSNKQWYSLQSILDSLKIMDYLQEKVTSSYSSYQEKVNEIGLEFLLDSAEYITMSNIDKKEKVDLLTQLSVLIDRKYANIKEKEVTFGSIMIDKYTKDCNKEKYSTMDKKTCEDSFKCKVKSYIK